VVVRRFRVVYGLSPDTGVLVWRYAAGQWPDFGGGVVDALSGRGQVEAGLVYIRAGSRPVLRMD